MNDLVLKMTEKIERFTKKRLKPTKCCKPGFIFINQIDSVHVSSEKKEKCCAEILFLSKGRFGSANTISFSGNVKLPTFITSIIHRQLKKPILISFSGNYVHLSMFKIYSSNVIQTLTQQNQIKISKKLVK